jgi:hypothetical protein
MPSSNLQSHCTVHRLLTHVFLLILYCHYCNFVLVILFKRRRYIKSFIKNNFLHRLAQIRERGIQARIHQQDLLSKVPKEQPSTVDVRMVTIAPILAVLAAGYIMGIFILLIERCVHGNIF